MRYVCSVLLLLWCVRAHARIEVFIPSLGVKVSPNTCHNAWIRLTVPGPTDVGSSLDGRNQIEAVKDTKKQIWDTYKALGTANDKELEHMLNEDDTFPGASVVYIRSVSDVDNKVEGIMRVVTTDSFRGSYFNFVLTDVQVKGLAKVPLYHNYPDPVFRAFLDAKYPRPTEFGKLVFGEGVNKPRVLTDLVVAANQLLYFPTAMKNGAPDHGVVAEAVPPARKLYEQYGMKVEQAPITLDNGRVFMHQRLDEFYKRFVGDIIDAKFKFLAVPYSDKAGMREAIKNFDRAIANVSPSIAVRNTYTFGYYHRAVAYYQMDDFPNMLKDVNVLLRHNPQSREFKLLSLYAETGNRFNWITGQGDLQKAIDYLDHPNSVMEFDNDRLPELTYPQTRQFMKGICYIGAGKYAEAKRVRLEIEEYLRRLAAGGIIPGVKRWIAPQATWGKMHIMRLKENSYDPATGKGDIEDALNQIEISAQEGTTGLTSDLYDYKAAVLKAKGDLAGAAKAQTIADGLR